MLYYNYHIVNLSNILLQLLIIDIKNKMKIPKLHLLNHATNRHALKKFILVLVIFVLYFFFITFKYGASAGVFISILTWSFFVLCTPVADAGFLIAFPLRLVLNIRMLTSQIVALIFATILNIYTFFIIPQTYDKTFLLKMFKNILAQPIPFWSIILLSFIGTILSIRFGDELMDKAQHHQRHLYHKHKNNYRIILIIFLFLITFIMYVSLLKELNLNIPMSL